SSPDAATPHTYHLSLHDALPIYRSFVHHGQGRITILDAAGDTVYRQVPLEYQLDNTSDSGQAGTWSVTLELFGARGRVDFAIVRDRKSTRLNSSHDQISYAVFCL